MTRRLVVAAVLLAAVGVAVASPRRSRVDLPTRLTDQEFWRFVTDASEPGGYFRSANITNLTSNELGFQYVIPELLSRTKPGRVYLGVGPEQNYTYMVAIRPAFVVIFDIRRGNLDLQLMYKALFELSADRADFVSMLLSKRRPADLGARPTAAELFAAFARIEADESLFQKNLRAIRDVLTRKHGWPLSAGDLAGVDEVYATFYQRGVWVRPSPSYDQLMTATDEQGVSRSFLSGEASFAYLKDLQSKNLVVPVVGDFGGDKALRFVGRYLQAAGATVAAFYLSNVEQYLTQDGKWAAFCRNVAGLPLDGSSTFIRSASGGGGGGFGGGFVSSLGRMTDEVASCGPAGR